MALPLSGAISLAQVNTELGIASTTPISLNNANVRTLAAVPSGSLGMNRLYGKSNKKPVSIFWQASTGDFPCSFIVYKNGTVIYNEIIYYLYSGTFSVMTGDTISFAVSNGANARLQQPYVYAFTTGAAAVMLDSYAATGLILTIDLAANFDNSSGSS